MGDTLKVEAETTGSAGNSPISSTERNRTDARRTWRKKRAASVHVQAISVLLHSDALATTFSALYGKLLVVMGIAFPMAEVISTYIPPSFYEGFYLYLYFGSMIFLVYMYATLLRDGKPNGAGGDSDAADAAYPHMSNVRPVQHYGSFYLRMGAVAFGIGSMIYSGLEFGQYFELEQNTKCHNIMLALTPATRMAFIFIQMYFIFLNNEVGTLGMYIVGSGVLDKYVRLS
ncbi:hypothetical protein K0M31_017375 [Melipona bicolor]|uniref:Uncharacterized protein n=1 Tax=Melipona bicolor TaxID=60889 RepID=A0AA40G599_9HYME|nr:hypothetical protein K0M31_017375 [Melipona bicolor]